MVRTMTSKKPIWLLIAPVIFLLLYAFTGEDGCLRRARALFGWAKVFGLAGFNIGIWGHVLVGLWRLAFR